MVERSMLVCVVASLVWIAVPRPAQAWNYDEHREVGRKSYLSACASLGTRVQTSTDAAVQRRYTLACGSDAAGGTPASSTVRQRAWVYGQAAAIAGDHLDNPEQFFSALGGTRMVSRASYYLLALSNSSHFHPESLRRWRQHHGEAIAAAQEAARASGVTQMIDRFERAFYLNAFSEHFLHDSFCAGHVGFNRPGSSAAASRVFHNYWNDEGRILRNAAGDVWMAYGDGHLFSDKNASNDHQLREVASRSIETFLHAFVLGERDTEREYELEQRLPTSLYDVAITGFSLFDVLPDQLSLFRKDELEFRRFRTAFAKASDNNARRHLVDAQRLDRHTEHTPTDLYLQPANAMQNRAYKDWGLSMWFVSASHSLDAGSDWRARSRS